MGEEGICKDAEAFARYAKAEKELCERAGTVLTNIINEIESRQGITIAELRVTMDRSHSGNGWPAANCVIVREHDDGLRIRLDRRAPTIGPSHCSSIVS